MNYTKSSYWKMDRIRAFGSWKWILSVFGVFLAFIFCSTDMFNSEAGIIDIVDSVFWGRMVMLTIPFCTFSFGDGLCADCEKKYYRLLYIRGNTKKYLRSKIITCFAAACGAMTVGFLLFCFVLSFKFPVTLRGADYNYYYMQSYGHLLQTKQYFFYLFMIGFQFGLLAGILTAAGMAFSAFITNRLLVFSTPLFLYYFMINIFARIGEEKPYLQLHIIFKVCYSKPWENDWLCFGWVVLVTLIFLILIEKAARWGMGRRCING
ncbi:MAG: hypothetical protein Q4D16_07705 [Eubacteriales bacterium]|nr:hypothetical protein [Eubacteriales bacterium]